MTYSMETCRGAYALADDATACSSSVTAATMEPEESCWMRSAMLTGCVQSDCGGAVVRLERGTLARKRRVMGLKSGVEGVSERRLLF